MSNVEINPNAQMTKKGATRHFGHWDFGIPSSFVIRHSSFPLFGILP